MKTKNFSRKLCYKSTPWGNDECILNYFLAEHIVFNYRNIIYPHEYFEVYQFSKFYPHHSIINNELKGFVKNKVISN